MNKKYIVIDPEAFKEEKMLCFMYDPYAYGWNDAIDKVLQSKTKEVAEVRHGKWIDTKHGGIHGDTIYKCSVCKSEREAYIDEENYCPDCGAKMDLT